MSKPWDAIEDDNSDPDPDDEDLDIADGQMLPDASLRQLICSRPASKRTDAPTRYNPETGELAIEGEEGVDLVLAGRDPRDNCLRCIACGSRDSGQRALFWPMRAAPFYLGVAIPALLAHAHTATEQISLSTADRLSPSAIPGRAPPDSPCAKSKLSAITCGASFITSSGRE